MVDGAARYVRIRQQPTALETGSDPRLAEIAATLRRRGFSVQRVDDMDGWLAYHAVFVGCIAAALYRCGTSATRLADDHTTLRLMCDAITSGFAALRDSGVGGQPRGLALLHRRAMRPVAMRYWARTLRSPMGELCFAAHSRHAEPEMRALGADVLAKLGQSPRAAALTKLLQP
jgi:2-dehydropantoate 2-reductase